MKELERLLGVMARLRDPDNGCPWDVQQDFKSIAPYTIEEAYEVADAIERGDMADLRDELGDLLLQVVFHSQMANEQGLFQFEDVAQSISDKMVRRHPHVFADTQYSSIEEQGAAWEAIKASEREAKAVEPDTSALAGVALALPALKRAEKLGKRASRSGFDWDDVHGAIDKLREELDELQQELPNPQGGAGATSLNSASPRPASPDPASPDPTRVADELGDVLFCVCNIARHLKTDPEQALRAANAKFERRFRGMEQELSQPLADYSLAELEAAWQRAKLATESHK